MRTKPVSTISFLIVYQPPGYAERIYDLITIAFLVHQKMDIRLRVLCDIARVGTSSTHTIDKIIKQSKRGPNRAHITFINSRAIKIVRGCGAHHSPLYRHVLPQSGTPRAKVCAGPTDYRLQVGAYLYSSSCPAIYVAGVAIGGVGSTQEILLMCYGMTKMRGAERHDHAGSQQTRHDKGLGIGLGTGDDS